MMKSLSSLLDPALLARSQRYQGLSLQLQQHLPAECNGHFTVTRIHQQELVIMADSPVWATRLRQLAPQILAIASAQHASLRHVQIRTRLATTLAKPAVARVEPRPVKRQLSPHASQQIHSAADGIEHEPLKSALLKLSRHHKKTGV